MASSSTEAAGPPAVAVVVPVRDDQAGLRRCLDALARQTLPHGAFEVVVVDNGSIVDPAPLVDRYRFARLQREERPGSYAARNRGVAATTGQIVAFTDADCEPAPDWLEQGVAALQHAADVGLVAGCVTVRPRDERRPTGVELYEILHAFPQETYATRNGFAATANAFTTREVFAVTGGFDPTLRSGGDHEWGRRVADAGYRIAYEPRARVFHPARRTWHELLTKMERVARGRAELAHRGWPAGAGRPRVASLIPPVRTVLRAAGAPVPAGAAQTWRYAVAITGVRYMWAILPLRRHLASRAHPSHGDRIRGQPAPSPPPAISHPGDLT